MEINPNVYNYIQLKPTSMAILKYLYSISEPIKSENIAAALNLKVRAVDAAVTKSLVHYGLARRETKLTAVLKKDYNEIVITDMGKRFLTIKGEI